MLLQDFDFALPDDLIASSPIAKRDQSRLLCCSRAQNGFKEVPFHTLGTMLGPNDVLVLNNTRVMKARFWAKRPSGGEVEILLISPLSDGTWEAMIRGVKRLQIEEWLSVLDTWRLCYLGPSSDGLFKIRFETPSEVGMMLEQAGQIPLPPYMSVDKKKANMFEQNYQTVYAKHDGAIAAPTAGLHFTEALLETCKHRGVQIEYVTLHVGYGTFKPITATQIEDHDIHEESYYISEETAARLNEVHGKKRIIAVGTTVVRTLESACNDGVFSPGQGKSKLYIYPGYTYKAVDALITNFHLPKSSLLLLVSAFMGLQPMRKAYAHAIENRFRFYSFGDAMFIE